MRAALYYIIDTCKFKRALNHVTIKWHEISTIIITYVVASLTSYIARDLNPLIYVTKNMAHLKKFRMPLPPPPLV